MATGNALPLDPVLEAQRRQAAQRLANFQQSDLVRRNNANLDTTNTLRSIDEQAPSVYRRLLNNYAGRGLAYSSGYGYAYGDQANQIANAKSKANSALASLLAGYDSEAQAQNSDYQLTLDELLAEQAAKNAANPLAATVGPPVTPGPTSPGSGTGAGGGSNPAPNPTPTPAPKPAPSPQVGIAAPHTPVSYTGASFTAPTTRPPSTSPTSYTGKLFPLNTGTGGTVKVPTGMTAQQLSTQYNIPLATLLSINNLTSTSQIVPGMTLRVS